MQIHLNAHLIRCAAQIIHLASRHHHPPDVHLNAAAIAEKRRNESDARNGNGEFTDKTFANNWIENYSWQMITIQRTWERTREAWRSQPNSASITTPSNKTHPIHGASAENYFECVSDDLHLLDKITWISFFHSTEADILELRRRYNNMYVPSDFFYSRIRWSESFPCHAPFSIKKPSAFHIFHRSVENPNGADDKSVFEPSDADDTFSAKVISPMAFYLNHSQFNLN